MTLYHENIIETKYDQITAYEISWYGLTSKKTKKNQIFTSQIMLMSLFMMCFLEFDDKKELINIDAMNVILQLEFDGADKDDLGYWT